MQFIVIIEQMWKIENWKDTKEKNSKIQYTQSDSVPHSNSEVLQNMSFSADILNITDNGFFH